MRLPFYTLDVFTQTRFAGNPLAVVLDADDLDGALMQSIAREFNLSETIFVQKSERPAHTAKVRIFTPGIELPFAGHPLVGVAALLAELRSPETNGERDALIILETGVGTVRIGVRQKPDKPAFAEFDLPKLPERGPQLPPSEQLSAALSLIPSEIGFANHKPMIFSAGIPFVFVPVANRTAMARARPVMRHMETTFAPPMPGGVYLYSRDTVQNNSSFHARMFWPASGILEDPATGAAAAAFAGVVHQFDTLPDGTHKRIIEQGFEMGRPSLITLTLIASRGKLTAVRIGGDAKRVSEGFIDI